MTKHLGSRLKTHETEVKTQDEALGQNKASMSAKVLERLAQQAPPGPVRLPEPCLARSGERGHRQKGRSRRAHSTQQRGPGPGGTCRGAWRGPQRRDRYLGTEHGGVRESAGREDGVPFREGRQVRGARAGPATVPSPSRGAEGQQGLPPDTHTPARTGAAREREGGGRAGWRAGGRAGERGARGGGPARAAAPAPARKGSRAAAAGVGGGPAPVLAELTGGARFPVPPGVGDPGAVLAVTGGWRAAGPGRRRQRRQRGGVDWRALALPRRPLLSVCVCSKMAARLVPRDTDAGPPPPTPPRPRLPQPPRSRTPTCPPGSPRRAAPRRPLPDTLTRERTLLRPRHVTECPCNLRLGEGGSPLPPPSPGQAPPPPGSPPGLEVRQPNAELSPGHRGVLRET